MIIKGKNNKPLPFLYSKPQVQGENNNVNIFKRDSNLKTCLQPGLGAQKVGNHWHRLSVETAREHTCFLEITNLLPRNY